VLPTGKRANLDALAELFSPFDLVGLQESDPGSMRSGFDNQSDYLAERGRFPYVSHQANRRISRIAGSGNALLSRLEPTELYDYALPGPVPGPRRAGVALRQGPRLLGAGGDTPVARARNRASCRSVSSPSCWRRKNAWCSWAISTARTIRAR
jgi:hypothetical protein